VYLSGSRPGRHLAHEVPAQRARYPRDVLGPLDPQFILKAFADGATASSSAAAIPAIATTRRATTKCLRRFNLLKRVVKEMGIEDDRLRLEWISASEGDRLRTVMIDMVEKVRALGPLNWNASLEEVAVS